MSKVTLADLNQMMFTALQEVLKSKSKMNTRELSLFSLVDNNKGVYVGLLLDNKTSIGKQIIIHFDIVPVISKDVFAGIISAHLDAMTRLVDKNPINVFDSRRDPVKAQGRTALLDATYKLGNATVNLYSWSKMFT